MFFKKIKIYIVLFCIFMPSVLWAEQPKIHVYINKQTISMDDDFIIYVEAPSSLKTDDITLPVLDNFIILKGDKYNKAITHPVFKIITVYRYLLEPLSEGDFLIPSFTANMNGKKIKSNTNSIRVNEAPLSYKNYEQEKNYTIKDIDLIKEDFKFNITSDKKTIHQGEQVVVNFDFIRPAGVSITDLQYNYSELSTCIKEILPADIHDSVLMQNKTLYKKELSLMALFPQQAIPIEIKEASVSFTIVLLDEENDKYVPQRITIAGNDIKIDVDPVSPSAASVNYMGIAEEMYFDIQHNKSNILINESVDIVLNIIAKGLLQKQEIMFTRNPSDFEEFLISDIIETAVDDDGKIISKRNIRKKIIPRKAGFFDFSKTEISYFSPLESKFITLEMPPFSLTVKEKKQNYADEQKNNLHVRKQKTSTMFLTPIELGIALVCVFFIIFFIIVSFKLLLRPRSSKERRSNPIQKSGQNKHRRL